MMKRILTCFLVIALVVPMCFSVNGAEEQTDETAKRLQVLSALEIINLRDEGVYGDNYNRADDRENDEFADYRTINKRTFINYVCNIIDDFGYGENYEPEAIKLAEELGLIHKNQDDLSKYITYDEALTILVRLLGYGTHAEQNGGYPAGYRSVAQRAGLTEGVLAQPNERLQQNDVVNMLYNAINCAYVEIVSFTDDGVIYGNSSENSLIFEYRRIFRIDGVMEAVSETALREDYVTDEGKVRINGYIYNADTDFSENLGRNVEGYVRKTDDGEGKLLCVVPRNNREITVDGEDITEVSHDFKTLKYTNEDGTEKSASLDSFVKVVYNGQYCNDFTTDTFKPDDGKVVLINNGGSSAYDAVFIYDYKTVVAEYVSTADGTVKNLYTYDNENLNINLKNDTNNRVRIIGEYEEKDISAVSCGDVLRILESNTAGVSRKTVYISSKKISGQVSNIYSGNNARIVVDGEEYYLSDTYEKALSKSDAEAKKISVGSSYTFSLNDKGEIVAVTPVYETSGYALVLATSQTGVFTPECRIKLYTRDGQWRELKFADKITFGDALGGTHKGVRPEDYIGQIPLGKNGEISAVSYQTNSFGEITMIDLPDAYDNGNDGAFNMMTRRENSYRTANSSFDHTVFVRDNSTMWVVYEGKMQDEDGYGITKKSTLRSDTLYEYCAYNIDEFTFADMFVVVKGTDYHKNLEFGYNDMMLVESISTAYTSEGETVGVVSGMTATYDGISHQYRENEEKFAALKPGDLIAVRMDLKGYAEDVRLYYAEADGEVTEDYNVMHSVESVYQGFVTDINSEAIKLNCGANDRVFRLKSTTKVAIFDRERDVVQTASLADIVPGDFVAHKMTWANVNFLVVYR